MSTIDNRVVKITFDNAQFEKEISNSLASLLNLDSSISNLDGKGLSSIGTFFDKAKSHISRFSKEGVSSFDKLQAVIDSFNLSSIENSLDYLTNKFSTMGIIGISAINTFTNKAINAALGGLHKLKELTVDAGYKRAQSIENARFTLQGLLSDEKEVEAVMSNAQDSVTDTAYSYDQAATAAANFAATGIKSGKPMTRTLQGVAGVAATLNSDYSEIAHIFTTIAGNGAIMNEQINQFSYRGLNAAATLRDAFKQVRNGTSNLSADMQKKINKMLKSAYATIDDLGDISNITEADVRKLASKRLIDFETFSAIMFDRFGSHAKDANKTFTGSMANIRAALARTGEMFFKELIVQEGPLVGLFNNVRKAINAFNEALAPVGHAWSNFVNTLATRKARKIYWFTKQGGFEGFSNIFKAIGSVLKPIKDAYNTIFEYNVDKVVAGIKRATENFKEFTASLILSEDAQKKLQNVMEVTFRIISVIGTVLKNIVKIIGSVVGVILKIVGLVGNFIGTIFSLLNAGRETIDILHGINVAIDFLGVVIRTVIRAIGGLIDWIGGKLNILYTFLIDIANGVSGFIKPLIPNFEGFGKAIEDSISQDSLKPFVEFIKKSVPILTDFIKKIKLYKTVLSTKWNIWRAKESIEFGAVLDELRSKLHDFGETLKTVPDKFKTFASAAKDAFNGVGASIDEAKSKLENFGTIIGNAFRKIADFFGKVKSGIATFVSKIKSGFANFKEFMSGLNLSDHSGLLFTAGFAAYFAYIIKVVRDIRSAFKTIFDSVNGVLKHLDSFMSNIENISGKFGNVLDEIGDSLQAFQSKLKAEALLNIALAIGALAASLWVLSNIPEEKMKPAIAAIAGLTGILIFAMKMMTMFSATSAEIGFDKGKLKGSFKPSNITQLALAMVPMAIAILLLAKAVRQLGDMPWPQMTQGIIGMGVCLAALVATVAIFSNIVSRKGKWSLLTSGESVERLRGTMVSMLLVAASVWLVGQAVAKLGQLDPLQLLQGTLAIAAILTAIGLFMRLANKMVVDIKSAASILVVTTALYLLAGAIVLFALIPADAFCAGMVKICTGLLGIAAVLYAFPEGEVIKSAAAFAIISAALYLLAGAIVVFAIIPFETFTVGLAKVCGALVALAFVMKAFDKLGGDTMTLKFAGMLGVLGVAMVLIAAGMAAISLIPVTAILKAIVAMVGLAFALAVVGAILQGTGLIFGIYALCGALALFGVSVALIGAGFAALAWGFTMIGAAGTAGAAETVAAMTLILDGVAAMIPQVAAIIVAGFVAIAQEMALAAPAFAKAWNDFAIAFHEAAKDLRVKIANIAFDAAIAMANVWIKRAPELGQALAEMAIAITDGLTPNIPKAAQAMTDMVIAMIKALNDHIKDVTVAGAELAVDMVEGIAEGIENAADRMEPAMQHLRDAIIHFFKAVFGIHSPSTVMADLSDSGIGGGISEGIKNFANSGELDEVMGTLGDALSDGFTNWIEGGGVKNMINTLSNSLFGGIANLGPGAKEAGENFAKNMFPTGQNYNIIGSAAITGAGSDYTSAWLRSSGTKMSKERLEEYYKELGIRQALKLQEGYAETMRTICIPGLLNWGIKSADEAKKQTKSKFAEVGTTAATSAMNKIKSGFAERQADVSSKVQSVISNLKSTASKNTGSMSSVGTQIVSGIARGVTNRSNFLYAAIRTLISVALATARAAAQINSPSRLFRDEVGIGIPEGIAAGIYKKAYLVEEASKDVIKNSVGSVALLADRLSQAVEDDLNSEPVITPVVDLTDVVNKSGDISNMIGGAYALAMSSNIISNRRRAQEAALANASSGNVVNQYNNMKIVQQPGESMDMFVNRVVGKLETATNMEG